MTFRNESEFQAAVCQLARALGCKVFHPVNVKRSEPGFPDLVIAGERAFMFRELKQQTGRISPEQHEWIDKLTAAKADVAVWRPSDWPDRIATELKAIA